MVKLGWWIPIYWRIVKALDLNPVTDQLSAIVMALVTIGRAVPEEEIRSIIHGRDVVVFGAGPSLERDLKKLLEGDKLRNSVVISADDVTGLLMREGVTPHVVVTDMDGDPANLFKAHRAGSVVVALAHGDNLDKVLRYARRLPRIKPTTQVLPVLHVKNYGGFTDGDRGVYLAVEMGARSITLAGMDLGTRIGPHSKKHPTTTGWRRRKIIKLFIAKGLLESLAQLVKKRVRLVNVTSGGVDIKGFERRGA